MQKQSLMQQFQRNSFLADNNAAYIESIYDEFLTDPNSVSVEWQQYFQALSHQQTAPDISHKLIREQLQHLSVPASVITAVSEGKQGLVNALIEAYQRFGHLNAAFDPLGVKAPPDVRLELSHYHLTNADLNTTFDTRGLLETPQATLKEIHQKLKDTYCGHIGVQYSLISDEEERRWLREYVERRLPQLKFDAETKRNILRQLIAR